MIAGWSDQELLQEVIVVPREAYVPLPDMRVVNRPGWSQLITPSFKAGGFNEVSFCAVKDEDADGVIGSTLSDYRRLGIQFRWSVPPGSQPSDLAQRLEVCGMVRTMTLGMAKAITALEKPPENDILLEEVDATRMHAFEAVMAEGWAIDPLPLKAVHQAIVRQVPRRQRLYLASWRGEPAGVASYVAFPRSAYLLGAVVLPRHRGKGLYRALVNARINDAFARGLTLATSQAMADTSAPILANLGFRTVCSYPVFTLQ